jgi:hypothetical protein
MPNHFLSGKIPNKAVVHDGAFTQIFGNDLGQLLNIAVTSGNTDERQRRWDVKL